MELRRTAKAEVNLIMLLLRDALAAFRQIIRSGRPPQAAVIVIREQLGKHQTHVFSYRGHRVTQVNTKVWRAGLARAGIENFRWHDLRHTWASWHVQADTPLYVPQELGVGGNGAQKRAHVHRTLGRLSGSLVRYQVGRARRSVYDSATLAPMKRAYISVSP